MGGALKNSVAFRHIFIAPIAALVGGREDFDRGDQPALESIADLHREMEDRLGHFRCHADRGRDDAETTAAIPDGSSLNDPDVRIRSLPGRFRLYGDIG